MIPLTVCLSSHIHILLFKRDPLTDQCLDIRIRHDLVEMRKMEVFQQVDSKSFSSHAFMPITLEVPCSKF
jgi:hypothetical protein